MTTDEMLMNRDKASLMMSSALSVPERRSHMRRIDARLQRAEDEH